MADRIAGGGTHTCAILDSGSVTCWGDGFYGQLGYGNTDDIGDTETPATNPVNGGIVALPGGQTATALTAGTEHTCALLANGTITCWGAGFAGRLGYGDISNIGDDETPAANPANGGIVQLPGGQTATAVTAGASHTCALLANGTITCWGEGGLGQLGYGNTNDIGDTAGETPATNPVNGGIVALPGGQTATAITAGYDHTCALLSNGTITCWGLGSAGRLGYGNNNDIGDTETPATNPITSGILQLPGSQTAKAVSAGGAHTCALLANATIICWGAGNGGRLGSNSSDNIGDDVGETPANGSIVALPGSQTATAVSAGGAHTCAVLADGTVTCWGFGGDGQLGYGNTTIIGDNETPAGNPVNGGIVQLPGGQAVAAVTGGDSHSCAVLANGALTCWGGQATNGQLGYGNINSIGDNETPAANPVNGGIVRLPGVRSVKAIDQGENQRCALLDNGTVTCWGQNFAGELGYGNTNAIGDDETAAANPVSGGIVALPGGRTATALGLGYQHSCALLNDGSVTCWGDGSLGRLGYGNTNAIGDNETPAANPANGGIVALPGGRSATAIAAGVTHTCALLDNGTVTCWGGNGQGQLGYGNTDSIGDNETPADNPVNGGIVPLPAGRTAAAITAGQVHTCALLDDASVTCWGSNLSGQLGYGNTDSIGDNETPATNPVNGGIVPLPTGRTARAVDAGEAHTCALLDNGTVTCWGLADQGQLGYGNTNEIGDNETPAGNPVTGGIVSLPVGRTAQAISVGDYHNCALLDNATVTCWGEGPNGRLGYGNTNKIGDTETPADNPVNGGIVSLPAGRTAIALDAGNLTTCALLDNSSLTCWGAGAALGYGNTTTIGDNETPAANSVNDGIVPLANHVSAIDYRALTPARLLDTRATGATIDDLFEAGGARTAGSTLTLAVAGRGGVPADAASITLSVAAVGPTAGGFITVWPCSQPQPNASSINHAAGVTTANTVITGIAGGVCIFTSQATQLIADVVGYTPRSSSYAPLTPARYADTRTSGATFDDQFEKIGVRTAGSTLTLPVANRGNVPSGTRTVVLNVGAVNPTANGFITVHPCGGPTPNASNINYRTGVTAANLVITAVPASGEVCVFTSQATHVIVDVVGYHSNTAPGPSLMRSVNPGRLVDTRATGATTDNRYENTGLLAANATNTYQITNRFPLANANVAVLNITAVSPSANGFLTIWPCDQAKPNASSLNYTSGITRAVQVLTKLSPGGTICVASSQPTHLIIDANGTSM